MNPSNPSIDDDDPLPTAKDWLRANGYPAIAAQIDEIEQAWTASGRRTRRNWWEVLAGTSDGKGRAVAGVTFPVVPEARLRQARLNQRKRSAMEVPEPPPNAAPAPDPVGSVVSAAALPVSVAALPKDTEIEGAAALIQRAVEDGRLVPLLGAGASMSAPLSLPNWVGLVEAMAEHARTFQAARADLIRDELGRGELIGAATLYCQGDRIPKNERRQFFERTLQVPAQTTTDAYKIVARMPFRHCVTTNFDNGLRHAVTQHAHGGSEVEEIRFPNFGPLLATWSERRSYVYLHGRVSDYDSLVYSHPHFADAHNNENYREVLKKMFVENTVLAFGFGFGDPNFESVLRFVADDLGGNTERTHVAILPSDSKVSDELLRRANFVILRYKPSTNQHTEAVEILGRLGANLRSDRAPSGPTILTRAHDSELRELAPLYFSILDPNAGSTYGAACGAIVARVMLRTRDRYYSAEELVPIVATLIHAQSTAADAMVRTALETLGSRGHLEQNNDGRVRIRDLATRDSTDRLRPLVDAVETRAATYTSTYRSSGGKRRAIRHVVAYCMLVQGATVARAFRNQESADGYQLDAIAEEAMRMVHGLHTEDLELLGKCVVDILRNPDEASSRALFALAHAAYALEHVFLNPTTVNLGESLRWRMYLDSNVVMRVLAVPDPRHRQFSGILARLRRIGTPLVVLEPFAQEILGHAHVTGLTLRSLKLRTIEDVRSHVASVPKGERSPFLLWYLGWIVQHGWCDFDTFRRQSGIGDLPGLRRALEALGVEIEGDDIVRKLDTSERETLWDYLRNWGGGQRSAPQRRLRRNEATQVLWMVRLRDQQIRSWFLSIDSQLRQALKFSRKPRYAGFVMTPIEWAHRLASLHWGEVDATGFAEMMWSAPERSPVERAQYAVLQGVLEELGKQAQGVAPDRIRDAVDDYFARGPLASVLNAASRADDPNELEVAIADLLPQAVDSILDELVKRQPKR